MSLSQEVKKFQLPHFGAVRERHLRAEIPRFELQTLDIKPLTAVRTGLPQRTRSPMLKGPLPPGKPHSAEKAEEKPKFWERVGERIDKTLEKIYYKLVIEPDAARARKRAENLAKLDPEEARVRKDNFGQFIDPNAVEEKASQAIDLFYTGFVEEDELMNMYNAMNPSMTPLIQEVAYRSEADESATGQFLWLVESIAEQRYPSLVERIMTSPYGFSTREDHEHAKKNFIKGARKAALAAMGPMLMLFTKIDPSQFPFESIKRWVGLQNRIRTSRIRLNEAFELAKKATTDKERDKFLKDVQGFNLDVVMTGLEAKQLEQSDIWKPIKEILGRYTVEKQQIILGVMANPGGIVQAYEEDYITLFTSAQAEGAKKETAYELAANAYRFPANIVERLVAWRFERSKTARENVFPSMASMVEGLLDDRFIVMTPEEQELHREYGELEREGSSVVGFIQNIIKGVRKGWKWAVRGFLVGTALALGLPFLTLLVATWLAQLRIIPRWLKIFIVAAGITAAVLSTALTMATTIGAVTTGGVVGVVMLLLGIAQYTLGPKVLILTRMLLTPRAVLTNEGALLPPMIPGSRFLKNLPRHVRNLRQWNKEKAEDDEERILLP